MSTSARPKMHGRFLEKLRKTSGACADGRRSHQLSDSDVQISRTLVHLPHSEPLQFFRVSKPSWTDSAVSLSLDTSGTTIHFSAEKSLPHPLSKKSSEQELKTMKHEWKIRNTLSCRFGFTSRGGLPLWQKINDHSCGLTTRPKKRWISIFLFSAIRRTWALPLRRQDRATRDSHDGKVPDRRAGICCP